MLKKNYKEYYKDLYQIQDDVLNIMESFTFYLTGGTALSRFYLNHRYSDDLDFFTHKSQKFNSDVKKIISIIKLKYITEIKTLTTDFSQIFIYTEEFFKRYRNQLLGKLKIDFVNELHVPRFGDLKKFNTFSQVDNLKNILSNKLTALSRLEAKDIADIWFISKKLSFNWDQIISEAEQKEAIEELMVFDLIKTFPFHLLKKIKWITPVNLNEFTKDRQIILGDLLSKGSNSLINK